VATSVPVIVARLCDEPSPPCNSPCSPGDAVRDSTPRATGSAVYQDVIPDEFRHQAYVIEAVLQSHCCRQQAHDLVIYDRWFPPFGVFLDCVVQYRDCVDSLLALLPVPDIVFVLEVSPQVAARRSLPAWARRSSIPTR